MNITALYEKLCGYYYLDKKLIGVYMQLLVQKFEAGFRILK